MKSTALAHHKSGKRQQKVVVTWQKVAVIQKWSLHGKKVVKDGKKWSLHGKKLSLHESGRYMAKKVVKKW